MDDLRLLLFLLFFLSFVVPDGWSAEPDVSSLAFLLPRPSTSTSPVSSVFRFFPFEFATPFTDASGDSRGAFGRAVGMVKDEEYKEYFLSG